ncbi:M48 family metalloprotease [Streptomyces sp. NPDC088354]|uniref:M48 family metalloprotease n=1 Tax=Streptomyces sp. NPDC088354 TaxID=3365856 RepID=UPI003807C48E
MGVILRALRALILLCGFYLLSVVLLAALIGLDAALLTEVHGLLAVKIVAVSVLLAVPLVRGVFVLRTPRDEDPPGIEAAEEDEPRLWALVRELARTMGTRAPDRILLTADVEAAVSERPRMLGLLPGPRRLHLGVPLLAGLTEAQLRAVLVHEYGHFTGGDTRLSALVVRGRRQIGRVVEGFHARADGKVAAERARQERAAAGRIAKGRKPEAVDTRRTGALYRSMAAVFTWYGRLYLRASMSTARAQEFAADLAAARVAGREATASSLRDIPALAAAYDVYVDSYATLGLSVRLLPPHGEFFGGFSRLLAAREGDAAPSRAWLRPAPVSPYDSHPPIAERVLRIESLPADGRVAAAEGAASALLTDAARTWAALEEAVLEAEILAFEHATGWPELLNAAMAGALSSAHTPLHQVLAQYTGRPATLPALLDVIDDGRLWRLAERLPLSKEAAAAKGRAFRAFARPMLTDGLRAMVLTEFSARSLLGWEFSWSRPAAVRLPDSLAWDASGIPSEVGSEPALAAAVAAALADRPDTGPLRALLAEDLPTPA